MPHHSARRSWLGFLYQAKAGDVSNWPYPDLPWNQLLRRLLEGKRTRCARRGMSPHPAVMPELLVEFFIKFLTDPGDVVMDPFAGSNTTGCVAERLERRWIGIEADSAYAESSRLRFEPAAAA